MMPGKRVFWFWLSCFGILLQLGSTAQVSKLSKEDQSVFKKAVNGMEKNVEQSLSDLTLLKGTYGSNVDVCYQLAECYYKLKFYKNAFNEYSWVQNNLRNALSNPEFTKDQKLKDHFTELTTTVRARKESCKVFIDNLPPSPDIIPEPEPKPDTSSKIIHVDPVPKGIIEYADEDFIPFRSSTPEGQQAELRKHVDSLYREKFENKMSSFDVSTKSLMNINQDWLRNNATINLEWFDKFKRNEDTLTSVIRRYNDTIAGRKTTETNLSNRRGSLASNLMRLENEENQLKFIENRINVEIRDRLLKKLATIPQSIVMIGRIETPRDETDEKKLSIKLSDQIDSLLKIKAIERINGFTFQKTNLLYNDKLSSIFVKTLKGKARTTDTYFKKISKTLPTGEKFQYKIIRIEVNPYDTITSAGATTTSTLGTGENNSTETGLRFDAFRLDSICNVIQITDGTDKKVDNSDEELQFKTEEMEYIKFLCEFSNMLNASYQEKIQQAAEQFDLDNRTLAVRRDTIINQITKTKERRAKIYSDIKKYEATLDNTNTITELKEAVNQAKINYEATYKEKTTVTNRLSNENAENSDLSILQLFGILSGKCYSAIDAIKRNEITISVEKVQDGGKDVIRSTKSSVKFSAIPKEFRVLSINRVKPNTKDAEVTLFLNIAFKIGYNTTEMPVFSSISTEQAAQNVKEPVAAKTNTTSYNTTTTAKIKVQEPVEVPKPVQPATLTAGSFVVDESQKTMTENSTHTRWKVYSDKPTSYTAYMASGSDAGYSLPSFNELKEFFDKIAYQESNGNSFFSKLFSFNGKETAVFATSERLAGEQIKCLKIILPSYQIQEEIMEEGESMYIISLTRRY